LDGPAGIALLVAAAKRTTPRARVARKHDWVGRFVRFEPGVIRSMMVTLARGER
jgi:hypothetical protein